MADNTGAERSGALAMASLTSWVVIEAVTLFCAAGQRLWLRGWVLVGLLLFTVPIKTWIMSRANPVLLRERFQRHEGTESFDKGVLVLLVPMVLVTVLVAGLDSGRYGWSRLGMWTILPGIGLYLLGSAFIWWVMAVNPYLESTVRIQEDRSQKVINAGPYRFVRHPMYFGAVIMYGGYPMILGSAWAYVPVGVLALLYVLRTRLEDRALREKLPGYMEYSQQTRYRLMPGVW